jgi:hypothetical protein
MQQKTSFLTGLITIFFVCTSLVVFGQAGNNSPQRGSNGKDGDQIFTRAERMPTFENGFKALADTLKKQLPESLLHISKTNYYFTLVISESGGVVDIIPKTDLKIQNQLADALKHTSWIPGRQNGRLVKCYKPIRIELGKSKLEVDELPLPPQDFQLKQPSSTPTSEKNNQVIR